VLNINRENGSLSFVDETSSEGASPTHDTMKKDSKFIFVATYTGGTVSSFPISDNSLGIRNNSRLIPFFSR